MFPLKRPKYSFSLVLPLGVGYIQQRTRALSPSASPHSHQPPLPRQPAVTCLLLPALHFFCSSNTLSPARLRALSSCSPLCLECLPQPLPFHLLISYSSLSMSLLPEPSLISCTRFGSPNIHLQSTLCVSLIAFVTIINYCWKRGGGVERESVGGRL